MKKSAANLLLLSVFFLSAFTGEQVMHQLIPQKGMDDLVVFKKTKRDEIIARFGKNYRLVREYVRWNEETPNDTVLNRIWQHYDSAGISFTYLTSDTNLVAGLSVSGTFPAETKTGIHAGINTISQAELIYGPAEWTFSGKYMMKEYPGIAFVTEFDGKYPVSEAVQKAALKKKITAIDISFASVNVNR